ncbi:MAG: hypothetical protein PF518_19240 [Spirochaetaceae bacterium]|jgi:hypothetical protein|nr:hypothetical protein [Spirochaetaceae bacterium]
MYKDREPELVVQGDDAAEEYTVETLEIEVETPLVERFSLWLETIDQ